MTDIDAALNRQEQIWAGLYGPPRARELIETAKTALDEDPALDVKAALASIDAGLHDDDDLDEAGTMRPI